MGTNTGWRCAVVSGGLVAALACVPVCRAAPAGGAPGTAGASVQAAPPPPEMGIPFIDIAYRLAHPPHYPMRAVEMHHEGDVIVNVTVDTRGKVLAAAVALSSGYPELDAAALAAAKSWKYHPGHHDGDVPVGGVVRVPVDFRF